MEIVYDESTGTWGDYVEPYATLDVQTEEDWNKLEFMINNFDKLEEENKEFKRLLRLAVEDLKWLNSVTLDSHGCCCIYDVHGCGNCPFKMPDTDKCEWKHAEEALKLIGEDNDRIQ